MKALFEDDPYYRVMQLIDVTSLKNRKYVERKLKPLNMTYPQLATLTSLHFKNGISQRELADLCETDTTTMTVICDSLEKRNWVQRVPDSRDRRINKILLTDTGRKVYAEGQEILRAGLVYLNEQMPAEELKKVMPFLEELYRNTQILYEGKIQETGESKQLDK